MHEREGDLARARSFDKVVDPYDRARPAYPPEAARWLVTGPDSSPDSSTGPSAAVRVLELGAGTGKLTEQLVGLGHDVTATDPSAAMLDKLRRRAPTARAVLGAAEQVPIASRSVDVVVAAQAFHWFVRDRALPEVARVLRPRGALALVWNFRDERIPWVRKLGALIGDGVADADWDPVPALDDSGLFETVQRETFRFWQPMTRESLGELALSRSNVAMMTGPEQGSVMDKVHELYDEYGRGHDGMLLPYVTHTYRAVVLPWATPDETSRTDQSRAETDDVTDSLLIDFR